MRFNIIGILISDNSLVFNSQTSYVPRQYEEIEINGIVFIVKYVRYKLVDGNYSTQNVQLGLIMK